MSATASNAGRWMNCTGSVLMQTLLPVDPNTPKSESAQEGIAFNELVAEMLKCVFDSNLSTPTIKSMVGSLTNNGVVVDETMAQSVVDYTTNILGYVNEHNARSSTYISTAIPAPILGVDKQCIPEVVVWDDQKMELFISDGKYGRRAVEVFENYTLIIYALSVLNLFGIDGVSDQVTKVRLRIYQPRSPHVDGVSRDWVISASDLRGYANIINQKFVETEGTAEPTCDPGEWCLNTHCDAAAGCTSLQSSCFNHIDYIDNLIPHVMSDADLSAEYLILEKASKLIKTRLTAITAQCMSKITSGSNLPGLSTVQGYGKTRWRKDTPVDEVITMGDLLGVDLRKPQQLTTPTQCRNLGVDEAVILEYSETPRTDLKLIKDDGRKARMVFR